ncbi:BUB protein kinase [Sporothrix schenckii ATCC 58251]|uniref:BUB protein kinase n=1 Tax=Sporothrix schenckii (strain ATCC 58251 / de Perez 2211183) TaxID=1391915 RepID=U7PQW9_SPOS1|nr:BUB protein kinase [Sporothrix schenckii ATCC 58251]
MAASDELINFDVIESQKENIQSLPGGRSARKLAELYSPQSVGVQGDKLAPILTPTPNPGDTKTLHDTIRADFEAELAVAAESDDPLDAYDRYVRWTLDAYPSAQATPQSQLHLLLERATKAFVGAAQYRNDPRYLRLWLHYIHFFSDAPHETYVYLSRHNIGENLALFYEEYAAWLEGATRWAQADEVYRLGIERNARPQARLMRKYQEFEQRRATQAPESLNPDAPPSPALPTVRPVLAAKVDPFASAVAALNDPQAAQRLQEQQRQQQASSQAARGSKPKMAIFSDANASAAAPALGVSGATTKGWESIGSLAERKKENVVAAKPWAGETLSAGGKKPKSKMAVFKDAVTVNPASGKKERVFVDLRAVYPTPEEPGTELSFEEIWAANRGLQHRSWDEVAPAKEDQDLLFSPVGHRQMDVLADTVATKLVVHRDVVRLDENGAMIKNHDQNNRPRKKKVVEANVTQIIKANLDSPSKPRMKKKSSATSEPTMTMHTRAATDDIYEIFNQPKKQGIEEVDENRSSDDDYETDGDYTSGAESTGTARHTSMSDAGDGENDDEGDNEKADSADVDASAVDGDEAGNVSGWSDFAVRKDISSLQDTTTADQTPSTTTAGDTDDVGNSSDRDEPDEEFSPLPIRGFSHPVGGDANDENAVPSLPSSPLRPAAEDKVVVPEPPRTRTVFIPVPPEDYVAPTRPYRDPAEVANNRLPFMTPITERTESSLEFDSEDNKRALHAKTPSKAMGRRSLHLSSPNEEDDEVEEDDDDEDVEVDEEGEEEKTSSGIIPPEPLSSPLIDIVDDDDDLPQPPPLKLAQPVFQKVAVAPVVDSAAASRTVPAKGPIIKETQCNPVDEGIRAEILANIQPPLGSYSGFYDHRDEKCDKGAEVRRYAKAVSGKYKSGGSGVSGGSGSGSDRSSGAGVPVVIQFADCPSKYTVRREIGAGAFAPVYLVENMDPDGVKNANDGEQQAVAQMGRGAFASAHSRRYAHEALKMETPPTTWEFHMMRLAHTRLGPQHRATASLAPALECHLYRDETFLFLPFYPHGTLLDVVNLFRGESSGVMDETLAMFFAIELFRTVESLHSKNILHGDIKADNCLLRLEDPLSTPSLGSSTSSSSSNSRIVDGSEQLSSQWQADGTGGWAARGMTLIDFGRAIDMRAFPADVKFVADWKTTAQDCAEMREGRPWTWQIDYHGLAGTLHCLLFGKYMETVRCDQGMSAAFPADAALGAGGPGAALLERGPVKRYRIRETLKRYWQTDIWTEAFELLLNPAGFAAAEEGGKMPVLRSMRQVRERMETWLAANSERGVGLKSLMIKVEHWARTRK